MRIAIYSEVYTPDKNGVATHTRTLRDGLQEAGHEVLVVTADKHARRHHIDENGVLRCPAIQLKSVYGFGVSVPVSPRRLALVQSFAPDIIHIQSEFSVGLSGVHAAKRLNLPLVYTVHTMYDDTYVRYVAPKPLVRLAKKLLFQHINCLSRRAEAVIVPSKKAHQFLLDEIRAKEGNISRVPNAIDWHAYGPSQHSPQDKADLRRQLRASKEKRTAIYVGRLGKEKSVDVLLAWWAKAIHLEDNWQLIIVGDGPEAEALRQQADRLGIASMVTFAGAVDNAQIRKYHAISDVFLTASLSENNSISMLEAMASGLMVLERYDAGTADQISVGLNGDFFTDSGQMAAKLRRIGALSETELAQQRIRVRASARSLDTREMVRKTLAAYGAAGIACQREPGMEIARSS